MYWILEKCCYDIKNKTGDNNKVPCNVDFALMIIYTFVSIFNASKIWFPIQFFTYFKITEGSVPDKLVILINFIVLIRINISLYIKHKDNMNSVLKELEEKNEVIPKFIILTWGIRKLLLVIGYIINVLIIIFCIVYGNTVKESLVIIVIVSIIETFINNLIDNASIRFEAKPRVYKG